MFSPSIHYCNTDVEASEGLLTELVYVTESKHADLKSEKLILLGGVIWEDLENAVLSEEIRHRGWMGLRVYVCTLFSDPTLYCMVQAEDVSS